MRFVDDQKFIDEGATAHEVEGLYLDARSDQIASGGTTPLAGFVVGLVKHIQVVVQGAHPWRHFFFFSAGQETDVFTHGYRDPRHDDFGVDLVFEGLHQPGGKREQGLAGTGLSQQGDKIHIRIHQ